MPNLYDEYLTAVSKNVILNVLDPSDRLQFYCLILAKDYAGVLPFLKKKIPDLDKRVTAIVNARFLES